MSKSLLTTVAVANVDNVRVGYITNGDTQLVCTRTVSGKWTPWHGLKAGRVLPLPSCFRLDPALVRELDAAVPRANR